MCASASGAVAVRVAPIDARVRPKIDEYDLAVQLGQRHRFRVDVFDRAGERRGSLVYHICLLSTWNAYGIGRASLALDRRRRQ